MSRTEQAAGVPALLQLMQRLRDPEDGCPWDRKQDYNSIARHTVEEVYELVECLESGDLEGLQSELGDVLFQVVFYCRLAEEEGRFDFQSVVKTLFEKLLSRHPHVFPDGTLDSRRNADPSEIEIKRNWESSKVRERAGRGHSSLMDDVPLALPALSRAHKLQKRAAHIGFDWDSVDGVCSALRGELQELEQAVAAGDRAGVADELGDVLFSVVNLARHLDVDAESCLRAGNRKFEQRFRALEEKLAADPETDHSADHLERYWAEVKAATRHGAV